jgi:vancomycin resistance protein VanW
MRLAELFFVLKKQAYWHLSSTAFATAQSANPLPFPVFTHQTPLIRKFNGVDQQLQLNKIQNLRLAIGHLDGLVIRPCQTFSYWKLIGNPTAKKGYLPGMVLDKGHVTAGIGGGLCQLSNLIYWMALHTPLTVVERWRHSYDVFPDANRVLPFGSGATCSYPNIDLEIKNGTEATFQLRIRLTKTHLVGEWRSDVAPVYRYEIIEKGHRLEHTAYGAYTRNNEIWRQTFLRERNALIGEQLIATNKALMMYPPLIS